MSKRKTKNSDDEVILKFGLFGDITFDNKILVKDTIFNLKKKFSNQIIIQSLGNYAGADKLIKKYSLELGCSYKEHNPLYTPYTLYSYLPEHMYGKVWHPSVAQMHLKPFITSCDMFIIFVSKNNPTEKFQKQLEYMVKQFTKKEKRFTLIQDTI